MSSLGAKKFFEEMASLLQKPITIVTTSDKQYTGNLVGFDPASLSLCLSDVRDEDGKVLPKLFIYGQTVARMFITEKPFDLKRLAERLDKVFPKLVKLYEDAGTIVVMDKIRLTSEGVVEGSGPAAERTRKVYEEFIKGA
ncbi:Lsm family RNA-binding protein [Candidatus Hecatella orcuttiae]|jgi:small nuclear ribonucleoprotein (snRNP)-like protein|uniref:Lsm family RNA-binding protein n=1 Tax=Candidatus Hecatella orcuttiae TaxID=1935119 RepID=UPI002867DCF2|nr:Lsm family RNA-binding protein [Candidatus Hecatella orcuttiae]